MLLNWLNKNIDKVAHESLCNLIAWLVFLPSFIVLKFWAIAPAIIIAFVIGLIKEKRDPKFDVNDIKANSVGILRFIIQILITYLLFKHS